MNHSKVSPLFIALASLIFSCTKIESTSIGTGLIPPVDGVNTFDTLLPVITENFYDTTSEVVFATDYHTLGRINNDPLFGTTTGIVYTEIKPQFFPHGFAGAKATRILDSVVMILSYKGIWGDSNKHQKIDLYEIVNDTLKATDLNRTWRQFAYNGILLGSDTVDPKTIGSSDTLARHNETDKNQIRIRITNSAFINRFFNVYDSLPVGVSTNNAYLNDSIYKSRFRGLAIVPDTSHPVFGGLNGANGLMSISLNDPDTKLSFYYSYKAHVDSVRRDTTTSNFTFRTNLDGHGNAIIRDYTGAAAVPFLAAGADNEVYIQTRPGLSAKVRIPDLGLVSNRVVHRAELIIEQVPHSSLDDVLTPPNLFLTAYSADSSRRFMLPSNDIELGSNGVENYSTFGGFPFKRTVNGVTVQSYNFNLTRYVQGIVTKKHRNYTLELFAPYDDVIYTAEGGVGFSAIVGNGSVNPVAQGRVRVGGGSHSQYNMRLRIIYSRL